MLKRKRTWLLLALLLTVGVGVYFEPSYCVRGWLHGEAFFEGRPTSYWRTVIERDLQEGSVINGDVPPPPLNWYKRFMNWVGCQTETNWSSHLIDKAAAPVLRELAEDDAPPVAGFARDALGYPLFGRFPIDRVDQYARMLFWMDLIRKHNLQQWPAP